MPCTPFAPAEGPSSPPRGAERLRHALRPSALLRAVAGGWSTKRGTVAGWRGFGGTPPGYAVPRAERRARFLTTLLVLLVVLAALPLVYRSWLSPPFSYRAGPFRLVRLVDGNLFTTSFRRPVSPEVYAFNGSAVPQDRFLEWRQGDLGVGVDDAGRRSFQGFFAVTRASYPAGSYVVTDMVPYPAAEHRHMTAENVFAVQTAGTRRTGLIDYVFVAYTQSDHAHVLQIGYAQGLIRNAHTTFLLARPGVWHDLPVTVSTDGAHRFEVWLGEHLVYQGDRLHMLIPPPFQVYLEVQARDTDYTAVFRRLDIYRGRAVTILGLPAGAEVVWQAGGRLLRARASEGKAALLLPPPLLTEKGVLLLQEGRRTLRFQGVTLHGGDVFRLEEGPSL
jgi:hypothetical protein